MSDPYSILGVDRNATDEDVKRAYRKLSRQYHPDANINNPKKDEAEAKFKEVQQAYQQIMDEREKGYTSGYGSSDGSGYGGYDPFGGFGGFGFLSFGTAGGQRQNHGQCQYDGENLFHCFASFLFFSQQTRKCRIVKQNSFIPFFNFVSFSFRNRKSHGIVFARLYLLLI